MVNNSFKQKKRIKCSIPGEIYTLLRAIKGKLLPARVIRNLESCSNISQTIDFFLESHYCEIVKTNLISADKFDDLEVCLDQFYMSQVNKVLSLIRENIPYILPIFIIPFDILNTKTLLRFVNIHHNMVLLKKSIFTAGSYENVDLNEFASVRTFDALLEKLQKMELPFLDVMNNNKKLLEVDTQYSRFEHILAKHAFELIYQIMWSIKPEEMVCEGKLIQHAIDLINLRTALNYLEEKEPFENVDDLFINHGKFINYKNFKYLLCCKTIENFLNNIKSKRLLVFMEDGLLNYINIKNTLAFERQIDKFDLQVKKWFSIQFPSSIAIIEYYLTLLKNELINLKILTRGIHYKLPMGTVQRELIYV